MREEIHPHDAAVMPEYELEELALESDFQAKYELEERLAAAENQQPVLKSSSTDSVGGHTLSVMGGRIEDNTIYMPWQEAPEGEFPFAKIEDDKIYKLTSTDRGEVPFAKIEDDKIYKLTSAGWSEVPSAKIGDDKIITPV